MRKPLTPLSCVALAATIIGVAGIVMVSFGSDDISMRWANKDFANYWVAARLALEGHVLDVFGPPEVYLAHMRGFFGPTYPWHAWSYPPHYLLLMLPLGLLPYKAAFILFLLLTFALLCAALRLASPQAKWWQLLLILPAAVTNADAAQNGFLLSALMLTGLALRDKRPVLAGICFGLLTVKPQLGVLLPLLFVLERQWRTIASACITAIALVSLSAVVFGINAWAGFFDEVLPYQALIMKELEGLFPYMMPTVFGSARSQGLHASAAFALHLPFAAAVLILYGISLRRLDRPETRATSTIFATVLAMPYLVNYDLVVLVASAILLTERHMLSPGRRYTLIVLAFIPFITPLLSFAGWPIAPLVILAAWLGLLAQENALPRLRHGSTRAKA